MTEETETISKYTAKDIVDAADDKKPSTVSTAYADMMLDRIHDLVRAKQMEVAKMFSQPVEVDKGEDSGSGNSE